MRGLEKNCTRWRRHTDISTDGHGDSMTNSAQWGRVGENLQEDNERLKIRVKYLGEYVELKENKNKETSNNESEDGNTEG